MKADFFGAFTALRRHLLDNVPEIGEILTHFDEPFLLYKDRASMVDLDIGIDEKNALYLAVLLYVSTTGNTADAILEAQMKKNGFIIRALFGRVLPREIYKLSLEKMFNSNPDPASPKTAMTTIVLRIYTDVITDCMEE